MLVGDAPVSEAGPILQGAIAQHEIEAVLRYVDEPIVGIDVGSELQIRVGESDQNRGDAPLVKRTVIDTRGHPAISRRLDSGIVATACTIAVTSRIELFAAERSGASLLSVDFSKAFADLSPSNVVDKYNRLYHRYKRLD